MNLINDPFLIVTDVVDQKTPITLSQLINPDYRDISFPRADFTGAAWQFAIGVLQTTFYPETEQQWLEYYLTPPDEQQLQDAFSAVVHAFNVAGDGPLFMQDFDSLNDVKAPNAIEGLLMEAPGGNALKLNTDHFVKRNSVGSLSESLAALALFTQQLNASSGGVGYRVGIRGGGPLTNLVLPADPNATLWQKIWLNVLSVQAWPELRQPRDFNDGSIFPWLAPTKDSKAKNTEILQKDIHPLHMFWAMPRRVRLLADEQPGTCSMSGKHGNTYSQFLTKNYGNNYAGDWWHPLTHYRLDQKKNENLSTKGKPLNFKHWHGLTMLDESDKKMANYPARVVQCWDEYRADLLADATDTEYLNPQLFLFGYDMDNAKVKGWYTATMPILHCDAEQRDQMIDLINALLKVVDDTQFALRVCLKEAWQGNSNKQTLDLSTFDTDFYQRTETRYYQVMHDLFTQRQNGKYPQSVKQFLNGINDVALALFDEVTIDNPDSDKQRHKNRYFTARNKLKAMLYGSKKRKDFLTEYPINEKENN